MWIHTHGLRRSLRVVAYEWRLQRQHLRSVRQARRYRGQTGLLLDLGSGPSHRAGWIAIDRHPAADLQLDLREEFPFDSASADWIYSEHFFEHLSYPKEAGRFLRECRRVLRSGGRLDLGVPDSEWPLQAYSHDGAGYFQLARERFHPKGCDTRLHHLNFHFRQGDEHKYAYDEETLLRVLQKQGFTSVRRRDYDPALDSAHRQPGTLYLTAENP